MLKIQDLSLIWATRNLLRKARLEVVPIFPASNLLAMHLDLLFSKLEISCVLDVGARCGDYGIFLRRNGYRGTIISFEPVRENFKDLAKAAARDSRWHCFNYALGAEDDVASINVSKRTHFSSFRQPNSTAKTIFGEAPEVQRSEEVEIRQLDGVLDVLPITPGGGMYLKLDTQGWDLEVLKGAQRTLGYITALQTEVSVQPIYENMPVMQDSLSVISKYGFTPSGFFPVTLDYSRLSLIEFDLVAVRSPQLFVCERRGFSASGSLYADLAPIVYWADGCRLLSGLPVSGLGFLPRV
jgi:FkbM family methyltransferase